MTRLTYEIITRDKVFSADTYAEAQRIKGQYAGALIKRKYTPIPEKSNLFTKIKRVPAKLG